MSAIRQQGMAFAAMAVGVCTYQWTRGIPDGAGALPVLAFLIVLLGVPHGALDTLLAARTLPIRTPLQWSLFVGAYLALTGLVMVAWQQWPLLLLALFLAVSVGHFAGDPEGQCPPWIRLLYGGAPVVLPVLLHRDAVSVLFSFLAPGGAASTLVGALDVLAWPWLLALSVGIAVQARQDWRGSVEMAALAVLSIAATPLVSFTVFFCGMHSARHILRCLHLDSGQQNERDGWPQQPPTPSGRTILRAAGAAVPPMLATLALLLLYWANANHLALEPRIVQTVFVGLAALTLPHVILVDGVYRLRAS